MEAEGTCLLWSTATEENQGEDQEPNQEDNFGAGEPELRFAIVADGQKVETDDKDEHDGDPHRHVDVVGPVVDDQAGPGDFGKTSSVPWPQKKGLGSGEHTFVRDKDAKGIPIQISHGKAHAFRNIVATVRRHALTIDRHVGCHFGDGGHDEVDEDRHNHKTGQNEGGAAQS